MSAQDVPNQVPAPAVIAHVPASQRPVGITVVGTLGAVVGVLMLAGGCFLLIVSLMADVGRSWGIDSLVGLFAIIVLIAGIPSLVVSIGLLRLKNWARIVAIIGSALGSLGFLAELRFLPSSPRTVVFLLLRGAFDIWLLIYLLKPHVKRAFGATTF